MASKPFQRSFGGWFDTLKEWRRINGAAVAAPSLLSKVTFRMNYSEISYLTTSCRIMLGISWCSSFHFYVPPFLLDNEKRMVITMIDHDMVEDCSKRFTLIRPICL